VSRLDAVPQQPSAKVEKESAIRRSTDFAIAGAIALAAISALLATSRDYAMVWDEGHTVRRDRLLAEWFARVADPRQRSRMFSRSQLETSWPFSREEPDGHPPFYALLGVAGWATTHWALDPLTAYRFGPMMLFGMTAGVVYLHLTRRIGRLAGIAGSAALVCMPRVFSHAHYAHYDGPMTCLWLLAQVAFLRSLQTKGWAVPFGFLLGLAAGTKFTGWFAAVPPALWVLSCEWLPAVVRRSKPPALPSNASGPTWYGTWAVLIALPVAALTLYLIHPPWWSDPISGVRRFLASNLTRSATKPIPTLYLGQVYGFSLPWHNTMVLTAVTTPVLTLALASYGTISSIKRRRESPAGWLWVLSWATLMVVRALPNAPGHDGIRLILPSVASLAVLAGIGAGRLRDALALTKLRWLPHIVVAVAVAEGAVGISQTYPYTLSYYNFAVGGLPGAERLGFELTYYYDTLGPEFLAWVRAVDQGGGAELGFPGPLVTLPYLIEWGMLPSGVRIIGQSLERAVMPYYVLQRRIGVYLPYDWWLERNGTASFAVRRQGVDLLRVYPYRDGADAYLQTRDETIPEPIRRAMDAAQSSGAGVSRSSR
jgi:hypothetical protein